MHFAAQLVFATLRQPLLSRSRDYRQKLTRPLQQVLQVNVKSEENRHIAFFGDRAVDSQTVLRSSMLGVVELSDWN